MSFGRLRQRIVLKCVQHVQYHFFFSVNQSDHCFLVSSLPSSSLKLHIGRLYSRRRIIRLDELGQTFVFCLVTCLQCKDGHKTHYQSIRTVFCCSYRRIIRLVPVITLQTKNQTNNECLPKLIHTGNASSSVKTASISYEVLETPA